MGGGDRQDYVCVTRPHRDTVSDRRCLQGPDPSQLPSAGSPKASRIASPMRPDSIAQAVAAARNAVLCEAAKHLLFQ